MNTILHFIKTQKVLCAVFALLLFLVLCTCILITIEMHVQDLTVGEIGDVLDGETMAETVTGAAAVSDTEPAVLTEPPLPYYTAEADAAYQPSLHAGEDVEPIFDFDEEYRVYSARPKTKYGAFNDFCRTTVYSLGKSMHSPDTAREGGTKTVTIDYELYRTEEIYSAVFYREVKDHIAKTAEGAVIVLIYDVTKNAVYAPLDRYDMTAASEPLSQLIRSGYETDFRANARDIDEAFLDEICTPAPEHFINIAIDDDNLYFFTVYDRGEMPVLLRAAVSFAAMRDYTWEALAAAQLPPPEAEIIPVTLPTYDLTGAVPESEMVDDDYFDDALFIGNSLIVGLQHTVPLNARYFAGIGLNVSQVFTKELIPLKSGKYATIDYALELVEFEKVYLMFGVNELGWGSIASFINYYEQIIDRIREVNPNALIYVQSILPVNEEKWAQSSDYSSSINNVSVATFNQKIVEMCLDKSVYFVNVAEVMTDETGNLYADATSDGIHIGSVFSTRWVEYLKTHTISMDEE